MPSQCLVDEYRGRVEDSGNQRGVTTLRTEGAQMSRIGSGTLLGDLHQAVLVNPSRPLNWNVNLTDKSNEAKSSIPSRDRKLFRARNCSFNELEFVSHTYHAMTCERVATAAERLHGVARRSEH